MSDMTPKQNHLHIALHLISIAVAIALGAFVADHNQAKSVSIIETNLEDQIKILSELSVVTDRNGADEVISTIVADCPRRVEYETLLNELGTLSKKDLITVQNLYESCGSFYAERKALMVSKMEREFYVAEQYKAALSAIDERVVDSYKLDTWKELITLEKTRSSLLSDQTSIQAKIIALLISGRTASSTDVRALVQEAQEIGELLNVRDHEIDKLRGELQS